MKTQYKVVSAKSFEALVETLNALEDEWEVVAVTDEYSFHKVLLVQYGDE
jgi:hypothetical protein